MRSNAKKVYLTGFLYVLITGVISYLIQSLLGMMWLNGRINDVIAGGTALTSDVTDGLTVVWSEYFRRITPLDLALALVLSLVSSAVKMGYIGISISLSRGRDAGARNLFDGFGYIVKATCLNIAIFAITYMWSLLLIVPGIIAALRYSMASWALADDPTKTVSQCLRESKDLMAGKKTLLFALLLSFVGWFVLGFVIDSFVFARLPVSFPILHIWLQPYISLTTANFYNLASGRAPLLMPPGADGPGA
jgi:uncharacterized membrane protein